METLSKPVEGWVQSRDTDRWEHVRILAVATNDDPRFYRPALVAFEDGRLTIMHLDRIHAAAMPGWRRPIGPMRMLPEARQ